MACIRQGNAFFCYRGKGQIALMNIKTNEKLFGCLSEKEFESAKPEDCIEVVTTLGSSKKFKRSFLERDKDGRTDHNPSRL